MNHEASVGQWQVLQTLQITSQGEIGILGNIPRLCLKKKINISNKIIIDRVVIMVFNDCRKPLGYECGTNFYTNINT